MNILFNIFLVLHIIGGAIGLLVGTAVLILKKGDKRHRLLGKIFLYSMLLAGTSALVLSVLHENSFLFIVGIFTIYLTATGKRYLAFKQKLKTPELIDHLLTYGMLVTGILFIAQGIFKIVGHNNFGIVFIVFGIIGSRFATTDISNYKGKSAFKNYWLTGHLQRMTGSYIAAITAFLVVNDKFFPRAIPPFVLWLLPTVVVVPLIVKWSIKYQKK